MSVAIDDEALTGPVTELVERSENKRMVIGEGGDRKIRVALGLDCEECYQIEVDEGGVAIVRGGDLLGAQYGVAAAMEQLGVRFYHPRRTLVPKSFGDFEPVAQTRPRLSRRGLHLHTLHPIEGYFATLEPGDESVEEFAHILDWVIKNRGDFVQWYALKNIQRDASAHAAWKAHTKTLVDMSHARGVEVGVSLITFGAASLQESFVLIDGGEEPTAAHLEERLRLLLDDIGFDALNVAFGEFFGEDPDAFLDTVNLIVEVAKRVDPDLDITAHVHVGDSEDQKVTYENVEMIYYFLVQFADASIIPWVHTVMYYTLFDDAGGAYHHEDFQEHREFLLDYLAAERKVTYFPETAYWVAFDNSIPTYIPLYMWSRWRDLRELDRESAERSIPKLDRQVLFSTGWEWGYWQNDYLALRVSYEDAELDDAITEMLAPLRGGDDLGAIVHEIALLQKDALIDQRLAAYMAGRDAFIDTGGELDIISQPDRVRLDDLVAMDAGARTEFEGSVLGPLESFADSLDSLADRAEAAAGDRWGREIAQGARITTLRAQFMAAILRAALASAEGADATVQIEEADAAIAAAAEVIAEREKDMHDPAPERLTRPVTNLTIYQFGYLEKGHTLCYWERERLLLDTAMSGQSRAIPGCAL